MTGADLALLQRYPETAEAFAEACAASRAWDVLLRQSLAIYGDRGPDISGCGRHHFPPHVQDELRALARTASAPVRRPRRVRLRTAVRILRIVQARDGSGFYGPRVV
jgi:hypothetical protein